MSKLTDFPVYSAKTKRRVKRGIVASAIVVILVMAYLLNPPMTPVVGANKIGTEVTISVERDGVLVENVTYEDDLILLNFIKMMYVFQMFKGADAVPHTWEPTDLFGDITPIAMWNTTVSWTIADTNVDSPKTGAFVLVGDNGTAPTVFDYSIDMIMFDDGPAAVTAFQTYVDGFSLTGQGVIDDATPEDIEEVGLGGAWLGYDGDTEGILLMRDVVTAIEIEDNDLITISYRFTFGTGYTQNMMTWLLYLLWGVNAGEASAIFLVDTAGDTQQINLYDWDTTEENWWGYRPSIPHDYGIWLALGNGNTAFDKDQYGLQGGGILTTGCTSLEPNSGNEYIFYGYFTPTSSMTAYEAGFYRATETIDGMHYFMLGRLTFSAKVIGAGITAKVEFTEEFGP